MPFVQSLSCYPVKSMQGISLQESIITPSGMPHDRGFIVVSKQGRVITGREAPKLVLVKQSINTENHVVLKAEGYENLVLDQESGKIAAFDVWKDPSLGADMGDVAAGWINNVLGKAARIYKSVKREPVLPNETPQSFVDTAPLLAISIASLDDLNSKLADPVAADNFRPNIVINGVDTAFSEDTWAEIQIGELVFDVSWGCSRCIFTTVDPDLGVKHPEQEPIKTLKSYRQMADKRLYFGQYLVPQNKGKISVGDEVHVTKTRSKLITLEEKRQQYQ